MIFRVFASFWREDTSSSTFCGEKFRKWGCLLGKDKQQEYSGGIQSDISNQFLAVTSFLWHLSLFYVMISKLWHHKLLFFKLFYMKSSMNGFYYRKLDYVLKLNWTWFLQLLRSWNLECFITITIFNFWKVDGLAGGTFLKPSLLLTLYSTQMRIFPAIWLIWSRIESFCWEDPTYSTLLNWLQLTKCQTWWHFLMIS